MRDREVHCIVVEDDESMRAVYDMMLTEIGERYASGGVRIRQTVFDSCSAAERHISNGADPHVLFVDLHFGGAEGRGEHLIDIARERYPDAVVAVVSGMPLDRLEASGADVWIEKGTDLFGGELQGWMRQVVLMGAMQAGIEAMGEMQAGQEQEAEVTCVG